MSKLTVLYAGANQSAAVKSSRPAHHTQSVIPQPSQAVGFTEWWTSTHNPSLPALFSRNRLPSRIYRRTI